MSYKKKLLEFFSNTTNIATLALRTTVYYFIIGSIWVIISDKLTGEFVKDKKLMIVIGITKGWIYVLLTSILLYKIISINVRKNLVLTDSLKKNYDELCAVEEELRAQFDEITTTKNLLRKNEERYELALNCSNDCIWEVNLSTQEFYASEKWVYITGYEIPKTLDVKEFINNFVHNDDKEKFISVYRQQLSTADLEIDFSFEFRLKTKSNTYKWILFKGRYINITENMTGRILGILIDISNQKRIEGKIDYLAHHDALTNLLNRVWC